MSSCGFQCAVGGELKIYVNAEAAVAAGASLRIKESFGANTAPGTLN